MEDGSRISEDLAEECVVFELVGPRGVANCRRSAGEVYAVLDRDREAVKRADSGTCTREVLVELGCAF